MSYRLLRNDQQAQAVFFLGHRMALVVLSLLTIALPMTLVADDLTTRAALLPRYIEPLLAAGSGKPGTSIPFVQGPVDVGNEIAQASTEVDAAEPGEVRVERKRMARNASEVEGDDLLRQARSRIVLHTEAIDPELPDALLRMFRSIGVPEVEGRVVPQSVAVNQVRYFHVQDRARAKAVANRLAGIFRTVELHSFAHYRPSPEPGLVEIWVE